MELINKKSPLPCYYQVYTHLKNNIENNTFLNGQQLPSERVLSEQFNVNRFTVRRAIENLIGDGLVYPIRRKGYFIKSNNIDISIHKKTSYTQNMLDNNLSPRVEILELETREPFGELENLFEMDKTGKIWSLCFLRYYNNIPFALSLCYLPYNRMPDLNLHLTNDYSLYSILNKKYGIIPSRIGSVCEVCQSDKSESKHLSVLSGAPLLKVTSTAVDQRGVHIERSVTKFRSDMVKIKIDLQNI
jgi:GntR family transcriptional regulator